MTTARQVDTVLHYVQAARDEGAEIAQGGSQISPVVGGNYIEPTVVTGVTPDMTLFKEEAFGPVLAVTPFDTEDEAIGLANATTYGLASAAWTSNLGRAHRMIRGIKAGVVHVNNYGPIDNTLPLGGVKQSGNGVDKSLHAFDKYLDLKTAWITL